MEKYVLFFYFTFVLSNNANSQSCTTIGQTPATAFPVCGSDTFSQHNVPYCTNNTIKTFCNDGVTYQDVNPFWYKFTCFQSGTLGFLITPDSLIDDYDWVLFDITNNNPNDVYNNSNLIVTYNWSGNTSLESARGFTGITGTASIGATTFICATNPKELGGNPPYSDASTINKMPNIIQGHIYLLMVSHFSQTPSGYSLSFKGGTAVITDPKIPALQSGDIECDHQTITIKLNKNMRCSSLAPDGSDFTLSSGLATIVSATGINCSSGFDFDSLIVKLSNPLPPGNYFINTKIGNDANTLLDDCGNGVAVGENESFQIVAIPPTPLDSITALGCSPNSLQLVFSKPINCTSIAPDGSDFSVTGPSLVNIQSANGTCDGNGLTNIININLGSPIVTGGLYQIQLSPGTDGNTIIDKCNLQTPSGSTLNFSAADTVSAQFSYQIFYGCKLDSIQFIDPAKNGINQWQWIFDGVIKTTLQNPLESYSVFGNKSVKLIVSNGVCSDTSSTVILLDNDFKAIFSADSNLCPNDKASFQNNSFGNIVSWYWDFGDGTSSTDSIPAPHLYPPSSGQEKFIVKLIAKNNYGCYDTTARQITKVRTCYITVASGFTPNGDGNNDYLYPLNAYKATNVEFRVFNRYGQLVFETKDWTKKWDGTINGKPQPTGTYAWMLQYTDRDTGKSYFLKGTSVLVR